MCVYVCVWSGGEVYVCMCESVCVCGCGLWVDVVWCVSMYVDVDCRCV